ncbi:MAG: hypothetical protein KAU46_01030 [Candidatus Aminicenantes bacterium]|nr:hypothetical protein [Candidatus Aminicenantes bacterium]
MSSLFGALIIFIAIIIFLVLAVVVIVLWTSVSSKWQKSKVEMYKKRVEKAERKKGAPLTKDEKETIAKEVDDIDAPSAAHVDIHSIDWRFDVDDEDVTYRKTEIEK